MTRFIQILVAIFLLLLITILGLYLYENFIQRQAGRSSETSGIIDQTLNYANYTKASKFSAVVATLSILKPEVSMFYMESGRWPERLVDLGYNPDDLMEERYIDKIAMQDGEIFADITSDFGQGAVVSLKPRESMGGASINWLCQTNVDLKQVKFCTYDRYLEYPLLPRKRQRGAGR